MLASVLTQHGQSLVVMSVEKPSPGYGEISVKLSVCAISQSDLHFIDGSELSRCSLPLCPGQEGVGVVSEVGPGVDNLLIGDRVALLSLAYACGDCEYCNSGLETLCNKQLIRGYSTDGCCQEYIVADSHYVIKIPSDLSYMHAIPILNIGATAYKNLKSLCVAAGKFVAIVGVSGDMGHLAIQYALAMGYRVIAVGVSSDVPYCAATGAEVSFDIDAPKLLDMIQDYTQGGAHGVLCLDILTVTFKISIAIARKHATVACVDLRPCHIEMPIHEIIIKSLTLTGSHSASREDVKEALDFAARGKIGFLINTERFSSVNEALDTIRKSKLKGGIVNIGPSTL